MSSLRSLEKEWIDLGNDHYSREEYEDCLIKLDRIGKWLGGDAATISSLKKMDPPPASILDVGCGGGLFTMKVAALFPQARVRGIDINLWAIQFAERHRKGYYRNLTFECPIEAKLQEPSKSYEVVMATLVCHHLTDIDIVDFITNACRVATRKVVINDLHRHDLAYGLFKGVSPVFFRNRLIQHDGLLSIQRGFVYEEWVQLLEMAGLAPSSYRIKWHWAFRWIIEIQV